MKSRIIAVILLIPLIVTLSGCFEDDGLNYIFKYDIIGNPRTLDPQTATDNASFEIIANMFDGLLELDANGDVQPAVAESYTVSDDELVYTFKLREDVKWYDGGEFEADCTADDFVFAFERLFRPTTKSTTAPTLYCIKNSENINKGRITDIEQLGVKASGDYELEITLEYPNPFFPALLASAPAMPCNREYYEQTDGRYGLHADAIASNGAFYMYSWSYDRWSTENNNVIMRRNSLNNADETICPYGLNFFIDEADRYANFLDEQSHVYVASGAQSAELIDMGYDYSVSSNRVWGVLFNANGVFGNENLRRALAYSINRETAELNTIGYDKSYSIVPDAIKVGDLNYRDEAGEESCLVYSQHYAEREYALALGAVEKQQLSGLSLIVPDDSVLVDYVYYIIQQWQMELGFFCNVTTLSAVEYEAAILEGNYDFAFADLNGSFCNPSAYLSGFSSVNGYRNSSLAALVQRAERSADEYDSVKLFLEAEKTVTESGMFIPLCVQSEYAFFGRDCEDIVYNSFAQTVIFRDAKHF